MIDEVVAELIVGVARDTQFGPHIVVGSGGIMVELMKDNIPILMPPTREQVLKSLSQLKCAPLFNGFRGAPPADLDGVVDVIMAIAKVIENDPSSILELDINPLMLLPESQGVVAADALISLSVKPGNAETTESELERVI